MKVSYADFVREDSQGEVLAVANYEFQRITFYRASETLNTGTSIVTVFHEFRHLQEDNYDLKSNKDGLLGDQAPFELDAEAWALDNWRTR